MERLRTRFIVLDEINTVICRKNNGIGPVREFKTAEAARKWAVEHLGNWSVLEQCQWKGAVNEWEWCTQKLY